jgi:DNA topoisomerase-1
MRPFIERQTNSKNFTYYKKGQKVTDEDTLKRIEGFVIPPAWQDVKIALNPRAKIQVEGRDASGKKQYIYSHRYIADQHAAKFNRTVQFALKLPTMRRRIKKDLKNRKYDKDKILACTVSLLDKTYLRVGNEKYAKKNASYGLTTLRRKHVSVKDDRVVFDFIGKSGKHQHTEVKDKEIARIVKKLDNMPGYEIFRYYNKKNELVDLKSDDVNEYIRKIMGPDFSAKDFRTWGATMVAALDLASKVRPDDPATRKHMINDCVENVARELGNTPAVARDSYIDPFIFEQYEKTDNIAKVFKSIKKMRKVQYLSKDEQCVIKLLSRK